jgi:hypothetical protein
MLYDVTMIKFTCFLLRAYNTRHPWFLGRHSSIVPVVSEFPTCALASFLNAVSETIMCLSSFYWLVGSVLGSFDLSFE